MKLFRQIFLMVLLCLFASQAFAAMVCVDSGQTTGTRRGFVQVVTCTFDTTPGTASTTIPATVMMNADDMYVYSFATEPGSTGPTINSDLAIVDSRGVSIIKAAGNGADMIDNSTSSGPIKGDDIGTDDHNPIVHQSYAWTITVTNNAVNNSSFILYMEMVNF
jgi:hypothetical protein